MAGQSSISNYSSRDIQAMRRFLEGFARELGPSFDTVEGRLMKLTVEEFGPSARKIALPATKNQYKRRTDDD